MADPQQTQTVTLTDGRTVTFPAGMSKDDMAAALSQLPAKAAPSSDVPLDAQPWWATAKQAADRIFPGAGSVIDWAVKHPAEAASIAGGTLGAVATGGAGLLPEAIAAGAMGGASAGGAKVAQNVVQGQPATTGVLPAMQDATVGNLAGGIAGGAVAKGAEALAPVLMKSAIPMTTDQAVKYGPDALAKYALDKGVVLTPGVSKTIGPLIGQEQAAKAIALKAAPGPIATAPIAAAADQASAGTLRTAYNSGRLADPSELPTDIRDFAAANSDLSPIDLDAARSDWNDMLANPERASRSGRPVTSLQAAQLKALVDSSGDALTRGTPAYPDLNRAIMTAKGLQLATQLLTKPPSLSMPGSVMNAISAFGHVPLLGSLGAIGLDRGAPIGSAAFRAAIIQALQSSPQPSAGGGS